MSLLHTSSVGDVTRGGQLLIHFFRMLWQVVRKFVHVLMVTLILTAVCVFLYRTDPYQRYVALQYGIAEAKLALFRTPSDPVQVKRRDGTRIQTSVGEITRSPSIRRIWRGVMAEVIAACVLALAVLILLFVAVLWFIYRTGRIQRQDRLLRGGEMLTAPEASSLLRAHGVASDLSLGGVPLIQGTETGHILVTGTTGSGKTQALLELLHGIRARGDRVICFSPSGDFISAFFRAEQDTILNPFDARCPSWDLWADCPHAYDYDGLAAALISPTLATSDPFWNDSARKVFSAAVRRCKERHRESVRFLIHMLTIVELASLHEFLVRTPAAPLLDPSSEKTAISVRSNVANYTSALRYLPLERRLFSLRQWVAAERSDEWVFLNAADAQLASVRPLLSMWLEVLTNALLSLPASQSRRIWLVIDELPALQKIPSLEDFLARARKHGGCGVIAIQGLSQLQDRYGASGAQTLTNLCNTWVGMLQKDPDSAKWLANAFGQAEVLESNTGLSYGANEIRDGVSLSSQRRLRPLVLESEIMALPPLAGFMRLGGGLPGGGTVPGVRFSFPYRRQRVVASAFIAGENTAVATDAPAEKRPAARPEEIDVVPISASAKPDALPNEAASPQLILPSSEHLMPPQMSLER